MYTIEITVTMAEKMLNKLKYKGSNELNSPTTIDVEVKTKIHDMLPKRIFSRVLSGILSMFEKTAIKRIPGRKRTTVRIKSNINAHQNACF